jgi:threonine synthase
MKWVSTRGASPPISFVDALFAGTAPDGGLYMPERLDPLPPGTSERLAGADIVTIGTAIGSHLLRDEITEPAMHALVKDALGFPVPLVQITDRVWVLELFHGPTLAFKDFGARFMARLMGYFVRGEDRELTVLVVAVPSGNFGNLTAGIFAKRIGLPVAKFVAATNANDVIPQYLLSGKYEPRPATATYSNAMDVGNPNNFPRLLDLCRGRLEYVRREIWGHGASDEETLAMMKTVWEKYRYIADPHTAVGILGWEAYKKEHAEPAQGLVLATAHAAKFAEIVEKAIGIAPPLPDRLANYLKRPKLSIAKSNEYEDFKQFLLAH